MHGDSLIDADSLRRQLCEARVRLVLVEAGLGRYLHLAGDEAATIITSLYTELPLQRDKPCMTPIVHYVYLVYYYSMTALQLLQWCTRWWRG